MNSKEKAKCNAIIHSASAAAAAVGAGLTQVPCSDNLIIAPIQIAMVVSLGKVFDIPLTQSTAKALTATAFTSLAGRAASQIFTAWFPGVGNIINATTAASITESVGWYIAKRLEKGYEY